MSASPRELLERLCAPVDDPRPAPATLVIVAHPDDEVVGAGARLPRLKQAVFAHVTDGAPRDGRDAALHGFATAQEYAGARQRELEAALTLAGISQSQTRALGFADQEASLHLAALARRVMALMREIRPEVVLTQPYEGGHPDHDATAFAVHAARKLLPMKGVHPPVVLEMTAYHNSSGGIRPGVFLPAEGADTVTLDLSEVERDFKRKLLECFPTQQGTLQYFPVWTERFRIAPAYNFTQPPHTGTLFYEMYPWGMTGDRFRALAQEAMKELHLSGAI